MERDASFGRWLQRRRKALDLTQEALAERVGCAISTIRKIETDERRPSRQIAELLAEVLEVAPEERPLFVRVARGERRSDQLADVTPPAAGPPDRSLPLPPTRLPIPLTPLVGRETELAELGHLLARAECRLLTLAGSGGIGKTRLAIAAAVEQGAAFPDGVGFVALAPLSAPEFIVPAIAEAIGFAFNGPTEPKTQLLNHLREREILLVLDNAEHLLNGVALFSEMLQHARDMKLLVTSRERLNLLGEWVFDVQGLPVPPRPYTIAEQLAVGRVEGYSSVTLFVDSARRSRSDFALAAHNQADVARICQLVDGMPLGIELAAAWLPTLACNEIASEIERNLDFLAASMRDLPKRHRSIRAVFDQSWNLLSDQEQQVLRRLAVFRGGCTRAAAERVTGAALGVLSALVLKSLLRRTNNGHYDMHELIRQYAAEQLQAAGEIEPTRDRHLAFFLTLAEEAEMQLHGAQQRAWHDRLDAELDNIRAALAWSQTGAGRAEAGLQLATALYWYWILSQVNEGRRWLERALEQIGTQASPAARAKALGWIAHLALLQADFTATARHTQQSQALYRALGDERGVGYVLWIQGMACCWQGDIATARARFEASERCFRQVDDIWGLAEAVAWLGGMCFYQGDDATAQTLCEEGMRLFRAMGDHAQCAVPLHVLGRVAERQGDVAKARALYEESLSLMREQADRPGIALLLASLGRLVFVQGDNTLARVIFQERLTLWQDIGNQDEMGRALYWLGMLDHRQGDDSQAADRFGMGLELLRRGAERGDIVRCITGLAGALGTMGQIERAVRLFGVAAAARTASAIPFDPHERSDYEHSVAGARAQLGEATFAAAWAAGQAMSLEQAIIEAIGTRH